MQVKLVENNNAESVDDSLGFGGNSGSGSELSYLNERHSYSLETTVIQKSKLGFFGRLRLRLLNFLLAPYLRAEQEFQANLVRHLNSLSQALDDNGAGDNGAGDNGAGDNGAGDNGAGDNGAGDNGARFLEKEALDGFRKECREEIGRLQAKDASQDALLRSLDAVTRGLERIVAVFGAASTEVVPTAAPKKISLPDVRYLLLENRYRGSEEEISARLLPYAEIFSGVSSPVLEIGSGRGELQKIFRDKKIPTFAIEMDAAMVCLCKDSGLDVRQGDALEFLSTQPAASLGGLIAIQVVEHLTHGYLLELFKEIKRALRPGAKILFETINTESLVALSHNYFRDPTHAAPLHPDTLGFLLESSGLKVLSVEKKSPYPVGAALQELRTNEASLVGLVDSLNHNIRQLNALLYGFQDYSILAEC